MTGFDCTQAGDRAERGLLRRRWRLSTPGRGVTASIANLCKRIILCYRSHGWADAAQAAQVCRVCCKKRRGWMCWLTAAGGILRMGATDA